MMKRQEGYMNVKRKKSISVFSVVNAFVLLILVIACVYPFYYIFIYSISDPRQVTKGITLLPRGLSFNIYRQILELPDLGPAFLVSGARTILGTIITVFCTSFVAFLFTQQTMPCRKVFYRFFITTMYVSGGLIPWYLVMRAYGFKDNFLLYIIPGAISVYDMILVKTFMEQLPASLQESATLDGAGYGTMFFKIVFPLCGPIVATIAVFNAVGQWNSWRDNFFLVLDSRLQTLQYVLYNYIKSASYAANNMSTLEMMQAAQNANNEPVSTDAIRMGISFITTVPILLVYPFMQRYFVKGIMMGAVKG